jgi:hypothetical protein
MIPSKPVMLRYITERCEPRGRSWAAAEQQTVALTPQSIHWRTQRASAGPELLLHETLSALPSFETETVPPVQVIEASVSPEPQVSVQLLLQASSLTT